MRAGCSLYCPSTTTCSPAFRPGSISASPSADLRDLERADRDRAVGFDDIGIGAVRTLLHDRGGDGQAVMPGRRASSRALTEFTRPQPCGLVGKGCLELDRAGGLQNLVVDQREYALVPARSYRPGYRRGREAASWSLAAAGGSAAAPPSGRVKISEMGSSCVTTTRPLVVVGLMMLPTSIWRIPTTPSIGEVSRV